MVPIKNPIDSCATFIDGWFRVFGGVQHQMVCGGYMICYTMSNVYIYWKVWTKKINILAVWHKSIGCESVGEQNDTHRLTTVHRYNEACMQFWFVLHCLTLGVACTEPIGSLSLCVIWWVFVCYLSRSTEKHILIQNERVGRRQNKSTHLKCALMLCLPETCIHGRVRPSYGQTAIRQTAIATVAV